MTADEHDSSSTKFTRGLALVVFHYQSECQMLMQSRTRAGRIMWVLESMPVLGTLVFLEDPSKIRPSKVSSVRKALSKRIKPCVKEASFAYPLADYTVKIAASQKGTEMAP